MKLLAISLNLDNSNGDAMAIKQLPFLGGMLHGAWENQIYCRAPELKKPLGLDGESGPKRYAILPPPFGHPIKDSTEGHTQLNFGIILYGNADQFAEQSAEAFRHCRSLRLGGIQDKIKHIDIQQHQPGTEYEFPPLEQIRLTWVTPLLLDSPGQRKAATAHVPPNLLRVVRSITRRIHELEPELAETLSLHSTEWTGNEEAIRPLNALPTNWQEANWQYGSRTKDTPVRFNGRLGTLDYFGTIPAPIHRLLQWGTWFGAGQRTALGQGHFQVEGNTP